MAESIDTPQIALPFEILSSGRVREVEQDSLDEIAMSVEAILRYPLDYREELPEFGVPDLTFAEAHDDQSTILAEHVARWEPRAEIFIEERPADWDRMIRNFVVQVQGPPSDA